MLYRMAYAVHDSICFVSYDNLMSFILTEELVQLDLVDDHYSRCLGAQSPDADNTSLHNLS